MKLRHRLDRIELRHREQFACAACAENAGIRVALVEGDEPLDESSMSCTLCGAPPKYSLVVRMMPDPLTSGRETAEVSDED